MSDPEGLTQAQLHAWRDFSAMQAALVGRLNTHLQEDSRLSSADYAVLVALSEAPGGRARPGALGRAMDWEKSRLSHHISRMERRGLLRRQEAESSRYSDVALTDAGRAAIEAAAQRHVAHVRAWFVDAMTPDQLTAFGQMCEAVLTRVNTSAQDPCRLGCQTSAETTTTWPRPRTTPGGEAE
ncbi:MarR family winged helix-turn-helix transcriptional regulator [Streptomyces sp. NBC_01314]|uniref:MarR family winged helix-turn-helix transcriptional regulator n=1 Tax=Streptomyces sp. NBC_01314 TaxID=2903821 RepID=UPI003088097D|nr:MarR family transcriptional regulator [Streptomyces sp. NBC_01314]